MHPCICDILTSKFQLKVEFLKLIGNAMDVIGVVTCWNFDRISIILFYTIAENPPAKSQVFS